MKYFEIQIIPDNNIQSFNEIIIAKLGNIGYDSFIENENGVVAYISENLFDKNELELIKNTLPSDFSFKYEFKIMEEKNWNEEWESNYEPVLISDKCYIRAPFHPKISDIPYEIIIEPKMSFGTAHHETTSMMIELILTENIKDKKVLDMGCGTFILGILAKKLGAAHITGIDNDIWAYNNAVENLRNNDIYSDFEIFHGDAGLLNYDNKFDIIFANINRNILLEDIKHYSKVLSDNGILLLSGFYKEDLDAIENECLKYQIELVRYLTKNNWIAARFSKSVNNES